MKIDYDNVQILSSIDLVNKACRDYVLKLGIIPELDMFIVWEDKGHVFLGDTAIFSNKEEAYIKYAQMILTHKERV